MRSGSGTRTSAARRFATVMAAVGALLVSGGVALMAAPTSAAPVVKDHPQKVVVCKYVGTPHGQFDHIVIVSERSMPNGFTGSFPYAWTDAHGKAGGSKAIRWAGAKEQAKDVSLSECGGTPQLEDVTPAPPTFIEPTCTAAPVVQTPASSAVTYVVSGEKVAGGTVHVAASLVNSETTRFAAGAQTTWDHTFITPTGCTSVSPPSASTQVSPPKAQVKDKAQVKAKVTTPTAVHAGLLSTGDTSTQTGLGLAAAGLVLLTSGAGLVLVKGGQRDETA